MPDPNVSVAIANPNLMYDGLSEYAPFAVRLIELYRYNSEAAARAATSLAPGTLVTTWTLKTIDQPLTDTAGPWRYAYYDGAQGADTWYRYRVTSTGGVTVSDLSLPWQADNRDSWTLKDIMLEIGSTMGGEGQRATATAGDANGCTSRVFRSSLYDAYSFKGQWVWNEANGEEVRVATITPSTGAAVFDLPANVAFGVGTVFQLHALLQPSELIKIINRVRDQMEVLTWVVIGLSANRDRYPAPEGVLSESDIVAAQVGHGYANSPVIDWTDITVPVEFDGFQGWLVPRERQNYSTMRIRVKRSIRDIEGDLVNPGDTTQALIRFLRPAVAWEAYRWLSEADTDDEGFFQLTGMRRGDVELMSRRYQPKVVRTAAPRQLFGPGMH